MKATFKVYNLIILLSLFSCTKFDNYTKPSQKLEGNLIDSITGKGFQTETGDNGVRFKMMDYSYSQNPTAWYFDCGQNGQYECSVISKGTYNVTPLGAFVPFVLLDDNGDTIKNESVNLDINSITTKDFTVVPFLEISWVGDPVVNPDSTISVKFKVERGTSNPNFQQECTNIYLFVNASSFNVGNNNYDSRYTVAVSNPNDSIGKIITLTTPALPYTNATYYLRVGARIDYEVEGSNRYNYNEPISVKID